MIKFRAWDKETNKYFEPTYQAYMGRFEELTIALSGRLQKRTCRGMVDESVFPGRYVVEQFTGLKDVNGMEIYVGDVVQPVRVIENCPELNNWISRVGKPFLVKNRNYVHGKWIARSVADKGFGVDDWNLGPELLIVGNVHENPELLEESK